MPRQRGLYARWRGGSKGPSTSTSSLKGVTRLVSRVLPGGRRLSDGVPVDAVLKSLARQQSPYVVRHTLTDTPVGDVGDAGDMLGGEDIGAPEEWRVVIERFLLVNVQGRPHQPSFRQRLQ